MSRIRSVHPGFFKDERLVPCSAFARLLFIGLGIESDDKGIFEWKPLTLKMNIFPGDNVEVAELLAELVAADAVMQFKAGDRQYGAIRNFRKYQKPKTPNDIHPMPDFVAQYVAFPQKGETLPPDGEKSALMEDGGGKVEEEDKSPAPVPVAQEGARDFDEILEIFPRNPSSNDLKAANAFDALTKADQAKLLPAARRYRAWFTEDCITRKRTEDAGAKYVPHLSTWIEDGGWRNADALPLKSEKVAPVVPMKRLSRSKEPELWAACERVMGRAAPTSDDGWAFPVEVVDKAAAQIGKRQEEAA